MRKKQYRTKSRAKKTDIMPEKIPVITMAPWEKAISFQQNGYAFLYYDPGRPVKGWETFCQMDNTQVTALFDNIQKNMERSKCRSPDAAVLYVVILKKYGAITNKMLCRQTKNIRVFKYLWHCKRKPDRVYRIWMLPCHVSV